LPQSMMLAAESLQRTISLEADQAIRSGLAILPRRTLERRFQGYESSQGLTASNDPLLAFMTERGEVRVIYTGAGKFEDVAQWWPDRRIISLAHAFTGSGSVVAAGAKDGAVFLWEVKQHEPRSVAQCDGHVLAIAASKSTIAAACDSGSLLLVDIESGSGVNLGEQWQDAVGVAFSHDGSKLGAAFVDGGVGVWDVAARRSVFRSRGQDSGARRYAWSIVTFDPSGELLLTAITTDPTLVVRKASSGEVVSRLEHRDLVLSAEFSENGRLVATACADGGARVFDSSTGGLLNEFRHGGAVRSVRFMPTDDISWIRIATAGEDGTARVWRLVDGREIARATSPTPLGIVTPRNARAFITLAYDGAMSQWTIPDQAVELDVGLLGRALAVQWSSSNALFAIAGSNGHMQTKDPAYRPVRAVVQEDSWQADAARASARGERFLIAGAERAQVRDAHGALIADMSLPLGRMRAVGADARTVAILEDDALRVIDVIGKTDIARIELPDNVLVDQLVVSSVDVAYAGLGGVTVCSIRATRGEQCARVGTREARGIAFSPDGRYLVWASLEPHALELRTRAAIVLEGGDEVAWGHLIAFTPDSARFVLGTEKRLLMWSLPDGKRHLDITPESKPTSAAFSHGGDLLAAGLKDGNAFVWQTRGGSEPIVRIEALKPADRGPEPIAAIALSDDNQYLLTIDGGGLSRTWAVSPQRISAQVCGRVAEDLTTQEWTNFGYGEKRMVACSKSTR
jgi:WD40 repeat protein